MSFEYYYNYSFGLNMNGLKKWIEEERGDINAKDKEGLSTFHKICKESYENEFDFATLKYCIETAKGDLNLPDNKGNTPLYYICEIFTDGEFDLNLLRYCVSVGGNINQKCEKEVTPFYWICHNSEYNNFSIDMLNFCIENGANINTVYFNGLTPFYNICRASGSNTFSIDMLKLCLALGANLNVYCEFNRQTAFYHLCYYSGSNGLDINMLKECIENGKADINFKTTNEYTPLNWISDLTLETVQYCVGVAKGDITSVNYEGKSIFYNWCNISYGDYVQDHLLEVINDNMENMDLLNEEKQELLEYAKQITESRQKAKYITFDILKYCVEECGVDINFQNENKETPLHALCKRSDENGFDFEMLKFCISKGGDLNRKDKYGQTPFYWLCVQSKWNCMDINAVEYCVKEANIDLDQVFGDRTLRSVACNSLTQTQRQRYA